MAGNHILFVGGESAGHISPLLAVLEAVQVADPSIRCSYVGQAKDLNSPLISNSPLKFERYAVRSGKLNRFTTWKHFRELPNLAIGIVQAQILLRRLRPDAVVAKGGATSVPVVLAAASLKIPIFSHETDAAPGLANRLIARYATRIFTAFPVDSYTSLPKAKLIYVGQPVRPLFFQPQAELDLPLEPNLPLLTVTGGSLGAHSINQLVREAWPKLLEKVQVVQLCGQGDLVGLERAAAQLPEALRNRLTLLPFFEQIAELFKRSTVVVSRAGGTIHELAATRTPTILIPLATAAQDHQRKNAEVLKGAVVVLQQAGLSADHLAQAILELVADPDRRKVLSEAIAAFAQPDAATQMAVLILQSL